MEKQKNLNNELKKRSKFYKIVMTLIILILLMGFIFMSLILYEILKSVDGLARDFIEFIRNFFYEVNFNDQILFRGVLLFQF